MQILIVDDNRDLAESLSIMLTDEGHTVSIAYNGKEALACVENNSFDIILLDMKLQDINGFTIFQKFRQLTPNTPIIMITGYRIDQLFAEAVDNCAIQIIRWPFQMESLTNTLNQLKPIDILVIVDNIMEPIGDNIESFLIGQKNNLYVVNKKQALNQQALPTSTELILFDTKQPLTYTLDIYRNIIASGKQLPAIIITTLPDKDESSHDALRSVKVTGCLFKPFEPSLLFHIIKLFNHSSALN